jgi:FAS-associated factor 2
MRLITRLEPFTAAASNGVLTSTLVHSHLLTAVLPKAKPFLSRLNALNAQRDADRRDREANERRAAESARRDEERVLAVRRREAEKRAEEQRQSEANERASLELAEKERQVALARQWRSWKRSDLASRGEPATTKPGVIRFVVRLGDGRRVIRAFSPETATSELYSFVECELSSSEDGGEQGGPKPPAYEQHFHFRLATSFPRWIVPLPSHLSSPAASNADLTGSGSKEETSIGEAFKGQGSTVNLVVDGLEERRRMSMSSRGEDSDEEEEEED